LTEGQTRLRTEVRLWVEKEIFPLANTERDDEEQALRLVRMLAQAGLLTYVAEQPYGGMHARVQSRDLCIIRKEVARGSALADVMFAMQGLGSYPITLAGTEEQKRRYLPAIVDGRAITAFALTEPDAGSDLSAIRTTAKRDGSGYRLDGVKKFVSNAGLAKWTVVFARAEQDRAISAFVVDRETPGFSLREKMHLMSPHPMGVLAFQNMRIDPEQLLGQEGDGLKIAMQTLDLFRATVGAAAVGLAERALDEALRYSRMRTQFGRAISEFQAVQFKLATMATELEAARLLVHWAAWVKDEGDGGDVKRASAMAKLFATEVSQRIVDEALQIHGGTGLVKGSASERLYRAVRALRIYEGTSEIQRLVIAREMLKGEGDGL
jgi:acyl-CoA dehydrogenase